MNTPGLTCPRSGYLSDQEILTLVPPTIFIIDDEAPFARILREGFELYGYQAAAFTASAQEIQNRVCLEQPDLLVLDIRLEGADGRQICQELTQHPKTSHIPVILMTAYPNLLWDGKSYGEAALLIKPFSMFDLLQMIDSLIASDQASTSK